MIKIGERLELAEEMEGDCPCGQKMMVARHKGTPVVMHLIPQCDDFKNRDLLSYMKWLNAWFEGAKS